MHPIAFTINLFGQQFTVRYYGLMYVIAIVVAIFLTRIEIRRKGLKLKMDDILDFVLISVPLGIILARLYYVLFMWETYSRNPGDIWKIWEGGLAIHGGLIGGVIALLIFSRWKRVSFWQFADAIAPSVILGQALGRIGNFLNGDAYGIKTYLHAPFGLEFARGTPAYSYARTTPPPDTYRLHPAMLYELVGNLIIFGLMWWWLRKREYKEGFIVSFYLIAYSLVRFVVEFFRGDALCLLGGTSCLPTGTATNWLETLKTAQVVSLLIIAGFGWFILHYQLYQARGERKRRPLKAKAKAGAEAEAEAEERA
ncbi:TPA: prolipoprotein diacylglyceryl transferase, partial [Candidatus Bipolaricaulota bacterium]|nr:prolipoprotein diacylglyceryl transferase [Candidatus Bipolaricaulota bacterium]